MTSTETITIPADSSVEMIDGLRVSYSRVTASGTSFIAASCSGLATIRKALGTGQSIEYRDVGRALAWQITLIAVSHEQAAVSITVLPVKTVEWYEIPEEELTKQLMEHYQAQGQRIEIRFYKTIVASYRIYDPDVPMCRTLERSDVRTEIVRILFPNENVLPWAVERKSDGQIRIGVVRGVSTLAECVVM